MKHAMMQIKQSLLLAAAVILVGCAHNQNVRTTGSFESSQAPGRSFTVEGGSAAAARVSEGLKAAGMKQAAQGQADYVVTVSQEDRQSQRRLNTGGKNAVAYDGLIRESVVKVSVARSSAPGTPVFTATAVGSDGEALAEAVLAAMGGRKVSTTGSVSRSEVAGRTFTVRGDAGLLPKVGESLKAAGMKDGGPSGADFIVTVARQDRSPVRLSTGGKNAVHYDGPDRGPVLTLTMARASAPGTPVFTATAEGGDVESLAAAAVAAIRG